MIGGKQAAWFNNETRHYMYIKYIRVYSDRIQSIFLNIQCNNYFTDLFELLLSRGFLNVIVLCAFMTRV